MRSLLAWLHLSDLHFGHPSAEHGADRVLVLRELLNDLTRWGQHGRPRPRFICVTGDVGFRGAADDYALAREWFGTLSERVKVPFPDIYLVPGNHDAVRGEPKKDYQLYRVLDDVRGERTSLEEVLRRTDDARLLEERFQAFQRFAGNFAPVQRKTWTSWSAAVDGEEGLRLRLVGLNTALLVHADGDPGKLRVDKGQQELLVGSGKAAGGGTTDLTLALTHHPVRSEWLQAANAEELRARIAKHCAVHLSGHVHKARFERIQDGGGHACVWVAAGALHEDERKERDAYAHGYNVAELVADPEGELHLRIWPRRWSPDNAEFRRDPVNTKDGGDEWATPFPLGIALPTRAKPTRPRAARKPRAKARSAPATAGVDVVAVLEELGEHARAIEQRLAAMGGLAGVRVLDVGSTQPDRTLAEDALLVVLLGARTGASKGLAKLAGGEGQPVVVLRLETPHYRKEWKAERAAAMELHDAHEHAPSFVDPASAAERAVEAVQAWLKQRAPAGPDQPLLESWERDYLRMRAPRWEQGSTGPLRARADPKLELGLATLYVPLEAEADLCWQDPKGVVHTGDAGDTIPPPDKDEEIGIAVYRLEQERKRKRVPLERVLCQPELPHLVIEGEPGSGKTALLEHVAHVLARLHALQPAPERHALDLARLGGERALQRVPLLLTATRLAAELAQGEGADGVLAALGTEVKAATGASVARDELLEGLARGRYLLLIDALDEVPDHALRERVVTTLTGLASVHPACRFVLTTRPMAYVGRVPFAAPLRVCRVAELDEAHAASMVERWCAAHAFDADYAAALGAALRGLAERFEGAQLAANPMLLTCVFVVYAERERLPDSTAELYRRMVDILCATRPPPPSPVKRRQLLELVFEAVQRHGGTRLPVRAAAEELRRSLNEFSDVAEAEQALDRLHADTGLLRFEDEPRGKRAQRLLRPWHRSFQEYLTASYLASSDKDVANETAALFRSRGERPPVAYDPAWTGVLRFLTGTHGQNGFRRAETYVEALHAEARKLPDSSPHKPHVLGLVASGLVEYEEFLAEHPLRASLPGEIAALFAHHGARWPLQERLFVLEGLGRLGDPRSSEELWVEVAGGRFRMGGDEHAYESAPAHELDVPGFRMAWRPVTVQDFEAFLRPDGPRGQWWSAGGDGEPAEPKDWIAQRRHPNRPVVGVSWFLAKAFCRWAEVTGYWPIPAGFEIDLPCEAEWEFAARGTAGRTYPWGEEEPGTGIDARANYGEIEETRRAPSPVGAFPLGAMPSARGARRIEDLAGNVWEWCLDPWSSEADQKVWSLDFEARLSRSRTSSRSKASPPAPRVLRGGSCFSPSGLLRAATRIGYRPAGRDPDVGFRVVCRPVREHVD